MVISIVIVNYNSAGLLHQCLRSICDHTDLGAAEIIVVDNASYDESREIVRRDFPHVRLVESAKNVGFGCGNNVGAAVAKGEFLLFVNTDTFLIEDSCAPLAEYLTKHPEVGAVGPKLVYSDRGFQLSAGRLPSIATEAGDKVAYFLVRRLQSLFAPLIERRFTHVRPVGWLTGACLMVRRALFRELRGFDEGMFMYFEDKDLCKRIWDQGYTVVFFPHTSVVHLLAGSSRSVDAGRVNAIYRRSQTHYYQKHFGTLQNVMLRLYLTLAKKM